MRRNTFVVLSLLAVGLGVASFIIMGMTRIFLSMRTAQLLSAPTMLAAAALLVVLTVQSVLAVTRIRPLEG